MSPVGIVKEENVDDAKHLKSCCFKRRMNKISFLISFVPYLFRMSNKQIWPAVLV